ERCFALDARARLIEELRVEDFVLDPHELAPFADEVTSRTRAHWRAGCRLVESARLGDAPVEQNRSQFAVSPPNSPEVPPHRAVVSRFEFEAAKREALPHFTQLQYAVFVELGETVTLRPALIVVADVENADICELRARFALKFVESPVEHRDVVAFSF